MAAMGVGVVTTLRTRMPGLSVASDASGRFVPVSETFTVAPALPVFGVKDVIVGAPTPPVLRVRDGEQIADGIIGIRCDIALPIDHLRQPAQVVVSNGWFGTNI